MHPPRVADDGRVLEVVRDTISTADSCLQQVQTPVCSRSPMVANGVAMRHMLNRVFLRIHRFAGAACHLSLTACRTGSCWGIGACVIIVSRAVFHLSCVCVQGLCQGRDSERDCSSSIINGRRLRRCVRTALSCCRHSSGGRNSDGRPILYLRARITARAVFGPSATSTRTAVHWIR